MTGTNGRFVAGAVCPRCNEMDRIVVESGATAEVVQRRCVACGFVDATPPASGRPPATRFDDGQRQSESVQATPVKLLDPDAGSSR